MVCLILYRRSDAPFGSTFRALSKGVHTMTEGPILSKLIRYSLPLIVINVTQMLFSTIDVAILGKFAGDAAVAAVGNEQALNQIFCIGGGDFMPNNAYFTTLGELIGHPVTLKARPLSEYADRPDYSGHLCQRCYKMDKLVKAGLPLPRTTLKEGLKKQIAWLDQQEE